MKPVYKCNKCNAMFSGQSYLDKHGKSCKPPDEMGLRQNWQGVWTNAHNTTYDLNSTPAQKRALLTANEKAILSLLPATVRGLTSRTGLPTRDISATLSKHAHRVYKLGPVYYRRPEDPSPAELNPIREEINKISLPLLSGQVDRRTELETAHKLAKLAKRHVELLSWYIYLAEEQRGF